MTLSRGRTVVHKAALRVKNYNFLHKIHKYFSLSFSMFCHTHCCLSNFTGKVSLGTMTATEWPPLPKICPRSL